MARRYAYQHAHVAKSDDPSVAICGFEMKLAFGKNKTACPDCAAKLAKQKLAEMPLRLEKVEQEHCSGYRSIYRAIFNDEAVGLIVNPHGWGMGWEIHDTNAPGGVYDSPDHPSGYVKNGFTSKEVALLAIPALREAKQLHTRAELKEAERAYQQDRAQWAATKAASDSAKQMRIRDHLKTLESIIEQHPLSEDQRVLLKLVMDRLEVSID